MDLSVVRIICREITMSMYPHRRSVDLILKQEILLEGNTRIKTQQEKFSALLYLSKINKIDPMKIMHRKNFEDMTPVFPNERLSLECGKTSTAMRIMDLMSPIGKGQRYDRLTTESRKDNLIKAGCIIRTKNNPEVHLLILLIDERPEEVTDIRESIEGECGSDLFYV